MLHLFGHQSQLQHQLCFIFHNTFIEYCIVFYYILYRVIQNDCRGFNNPSYTIHLRYEYVVAPMDQEILKVFFYDVRCAVVMHFSACSAVYKSEPPLEPSPLTRYSLERTRLSCWCLYNHKGCTYRAPVVCVTKTWSVVLLNKKIHILLPQVYCVWQVVITPTVILNNPVHFVVAELFNFFRIII